ncbi:type II secretion system F family protein [Alkalihalobacillus pseudalcaliphilus]|uniref:type II secretion system F family protein n=1 Tax=Alkalihalobacillus pseudalcaliphilus TaxID=79884 RepID=UPI00069F69B7|nr:type II secretion system F family protein [Alkalihalobacillus pseudalcaliphilus]
MIIYGIIVAIIVILYFVLSILSRHQYDEVIEEFGDQYPLKFMAPVSLHFIYKTRLLERLHTQVSSIQGKMISLYGTKEAYKHTRMFMTQLVSVVLLCVLAAGLLGLLSEGDHFMFVAGLFFAIMIPLLLVNQLSNKEKERKQKILLELPEVVNKIILLVNAGETVQQALIRCVELNTEADSPLYEELRVVVNKLTSNEPFADVMNDFSKKCAMQDVSIFTTTILLNYRKGGQDLILSLRELAQNLWEKRKNISRTKGEEASSKLVFPLMLIFVAVMIIVGYPAITIL